MTVTHWFLVAISGICLTFGACWLSTLVVFGKYRNEDRRREMLKPFVFNAILGVVLAVVALLVIAVSKP